MQSPDENELEYSNKRIFINNADSYNGEEILKEVSKILENNVVPSPVSRVSTVTESAPGEDGGEPYPPIPVEKPYEIYVTVTNPKLEKLNNVTKILSKDSVMPTLLTCGFVIIDISYDPGELKFAAEYLKLLKQLLERQTDDRENQMSQSQGDDVEIDTNKRHLILISTVMTWGCTKPLDPDTPEMPFVETDFRKRKPHPGYKEHYDVENEVIGIARKFKPLIGALVVTTGITFGGKEDVLQYWFQKAWENEPFLPILDRGGNIVPLINVLDLAQIIYNLMNDFPKKLYILAVEQTTTKQRQIIKSIGRTMGSGMFKCIPKEDAFLIPEITQRIYDLMTLNLSMEPVFISETMQLQWHSELPFAETAADLCAKYKKTRILKPFKAESLDLKTLNLSMEPVFISETMQLQWHSELPFAETAADLCAKYKKTRILKPFKIIVYGPPLVGKTTLAQQIAENYGLALVSLDTVVNDILEELERKVAYWETGDKALLPQLGEEVDADSDDEEVGDEEAVRDNVRTQLALLKSGKPLTEEEIEGMIRQRLLFRDAQNRGWVLDGYPTTPAQCQTLFERGEEADEVVEEEDREEDFDEDLNLYDQVLKKLLPDIVVSLDATDEFICEKAMHQPEGDRRFHEETVLRRLTEFRFLDAKEVTPLNFFDELDIHPLVVKVNDHKDYSMLKPYADVSLRMGKPCQYGKLIALTEEAEKRAKKEYETLLATQARVQAELEKRMQEEREEKMEYWSEMYSLLREEEEQALAAASEPMRSYLMTYIFPTLTPALLHMAEIRPKDPVDYLAEYLFKLNPTGKMLEPGYNLQAEKLFGKIKLLDEALHDVDVKIAPLIPSEADLGASTSSE